MLVGRNGSGKSALTDLIEFIFTSKFPQKNLERSRIQYFLETSFIKPIYETVKRDLDENPESLKPKNLSWRKSICVFELIGEKGELKISYGEGDHYGLRSSINQSLNNNNFFEFAELTATRHFNVRNPKNFKILRVKTGANIEDVNTSLVFEKLNKEKIIPIKLSENKQVSNSSIYNPLITDIANNLDSKYKDIIQGFINEEIKILNDKLKQFENNLTKKLESYWEHVIKNVKVQTIDEQNHFRFIFILEDGKNEIAFDTLSDGEKNLFNLIVSINTAKETKPDLIIIDEPEVYMHDDMIRKLVSEINALADELPETCIMLSTHNTVLIEEVASLDKAEVNLIVFEDKQVFNSDQDIDFINALHSNGVRFSPLMISKKPNLFIENLGDDGAEYRDFYLRFFDPKNKPNIVYIGSSNEVEGYNKFLVVLENILSADTSQNNRGIIDGDIWLTAKSGLEKYLFGESDIDGLITQLKNQIEFYIPHTENYNARYFNCWEIENIYLLEELLGYWKSPKANGVMNLEKYKYLLKDNKVKICNTWYKTFNRSLFKPIYFRKNFNSYGEKLKVAHEKILRIEKLTPIVEQNFLFFFDTLLEEDLLQWMPGKEVKKILENNGYEPHFKEVDFNNLTITLEIRRIIDPNFGS